MDNGTIPTPPSHGGFWPGRLWSPWDMQRLYVSELFGLCAETARIKEYFSQEQHRSYVIPPEIRAANKKTMLGHSRHFAELSLPMCKLQADECAKALDDEITGTQYGQMLEVLQKRMEHETTLTRAFLLTATETALYAQEQPLFGPAVAEKFPAASDDIGEAGKCLALGRGTATVMHLMRVMEVGLKALAKPLGIPYAPSWESYLKQIAAKIALSHKDKPRKWRKSEPFFRDVSGDLISVKQAWRNPSMHVVSKFTPEEAEDVFRAVRRFMQRLANGLP